MFTYAEFKRVVKANGWTLAEMRCESAPPSEKLLEVMDELGLARFEYYVSLLAVVPMRWVRSETSYDQTSGCGRFVLRTVCLNPFRSGYWGLTDTLTGREYPCRTEASAKTAARNIRNHTTPTKETK